MPISFGSFTFDERNGLLSSGGTDVPLPPRVIGVLSMLLERPGEVISRQALLERVWKDAYVTDTSLAEAVSFLRQALGDDPQTPRFIQTVHRRGYRFVAEVRGPRAEGRTEETEGKGQASQVIRPSISRDLAPWSIAVVCAALAAAALWHIARQPTAEPQPVVRFEFRPVAGSWFDRQAPAVTMSRDGTVLAWAACESATRSCGLYVRRLDRLEPVRLGGTDNAAAPFFSPDARWIGFFADGKLKKVAVSGGSPVTLADAPEPGGGSWNDEGRIVFSGLPAGGLAVASDQGGEVNPLTTPVPARGEVRHAWPSWLPDGRSIVFTITTSPLPGAPGQLAALTLPSRQYRVLRSGVTRAVPGGPDYLLLSSGGDLEAATFDARTLALTGAADSVMNGLATANGAAQFDAAGAALVAVRASAARRTIAWDDARDAPIQGVERLSGIVISPDGRRAAGVIADANSSDIWIGDLEHGGLTRLTYGGVNVSPAWSRDGHTLYFAARREGGFRLDARRTDGSATTVTTAAGAAPLFPASVTADGRIIGVVAQANGHVAIGGLGAVAPAPFDERSPALSPDERWIAFETDESGRHEVAVRAANGERRMQVSSAGGERPSWSADGRAIYYHEGDRVIRVTFDPSAAIPVGARTVVFDRFEARVLAVAPTGRLLVEQQAVMQDTGLVVLQWLRELRQKLPAPIASPR